MHPDPVSKGSPPALATITTIGPFEAAIRDAPAAGLILDVKSSGLLAANALARLLLDLPEGPFAPGCAFVRQPELVRAVHESLAMGRPAWFNRDTDVIKVTTAPAGVSIVVWLQGASTATFADGEAAVSASETAQRPNRARSDFVATRGHALRTPLNAILGVSQLLARDDADALSAGQRERVERIRSAGRHLLNLVTDVLDLSRIEAGTMSVAVEVVEVAPLIASTLETLAPVAAEREITLATAFETGAPSRVWGDRARLRQVFSNVIANAIKYNRPGGRVDIVARRGSALRVDSTRGVGSEFCVALREVPGGVNPVRAGGDSATESVVRENVEGSVLYIEGNPGNGGLVEQLLHSPPNVRLYKAPDGAIGLLLAATRKPELILIDWHLPDMDGCEVRRRLHAQPQTAGIPCAALSTEALPDEARRAHAAGFAHYWTAPLDTHRFLADVDALLTANRPLAS